MKRLRDADPFQQLPDEAFARIEAATQIEKFPEGTIIFQQNDPPTGFLYIIKEGLVEITTLTPGGADMVVDYRNEGQFFGGTPAFTNETYSGGARTVQATECFLIPYETLRETAQRHPSVAEYFTAIVISHSSADVSSALASGPIPALLTRISIRPNFSTEPATTVCAVVSSVTSATQVRC